MSNLEFYISLIVCAVMFVSLILVYRLALPKDSDQSSKLVAVVGTFSIAVAITAYFIAARYFSGDPATMLQFTLAITFLLMAGSLISVAISTSQLTGLRDTLATAKAA